MREREIKFRVYNKKDNSEKVPICKCGRKMIKNKGNVDMWICPSKNEKKKVGLYSKNIKLYHGTDKKNLESIMKNGLKRLKDKTYVYTSPKKEIAKKYGNVVLEIEGRGLDLRVWETDHKNQIMIMGDVESKRLRIIQD